MMKGPSDIIFNGLNADGTMIATLTVQVDELYDVEPEWALFTADQPENKPGYGTMLPDPVYGVTAATKAVQLLLVGCSSWRYQRPGPGEGAGASMQFTIAGARLIKNYKSDGTSQQGSFTFDMSKITLDDGGNVWAKGN